MEAKKNLVAEISVFCDMVETDLRRCSISEGNFSCRDRVESDCADHRPGVEQPAAIYVFPHAINSRTAERIFMKFDIGQFC